MVGTLLEQVIEATEANEKFVRQELSGIAETQGFNLENLEMIELREIAASYLQSVFLELIEAQENKNEAC